jgi:hypothetical protein
MNEQIKELYNKAWSKIDPRNPQETFTQAFAELIVLECASLVVDDDNAYDMLKHFGVEE